MAPAPQMCSGRSATWTVSGSVPSGPDLVGLDDADRLEHLEAAQLLAGELEIVGIEGLAGLDAGLAGHEFRVHPLGAGGRHRAVDRGRPRRHRHADVERVAVVMRDGVAARDLGLRMAELAPAPDERALGLQDDARFRHLARHEAELGRRLRHRVVVGDRSGRVVDPHVAEHEERPRLDGDPDVRRLAELGVGRDVRGGAAVDRDVDDGAVAARRVERGDEARVVAAGARDERRGAERHVVLLGVELGGRLELFLQVVVAGRHLEFDVVVLRRGRKLLGRVLLEELVAEQLEGRRRRGARHAECRRGCNEPRRLPPGSPRPEETHTRTPFRELPRSDGACTLFVKSLLANARCREGADQDPGRGTGATIPERDYEAGARLDLADDRPGAGPASRVASRTQRFAPHGLPC